MNCEIVTHINDKPIYRRTVGILPANKALVSRAKALRKAGVLSEVLFWQQVRNVFPRPTPSLFYRFDTLDLRIQYLYNDSERTDVLIG